MALRRSRPWLLRSTTADRLIHPRTLASQKKGMYSNSTKKEHSICAETRDLVMFKTNKSDCLTPWWGLYNLPQPITPLLLNLQGLLCLQWIKSRIDTMSNRLINLANTATLCQCLLRWEKCTTSLSICLQPAILTQDNMYLGMIHQGSLTLWGLLESEALATTSIVLKLA